jgi:signal transduction histidine kinase/HAMP domain-containing protein
MNIGSKLVLSFLLVTLLPTVLLAILTNNIISGARKDDAQAAVNNNLKAAWTQYHARAYQMHYGMLQASSEPYFKASVAKRDAPFLEARIRAWKKSRPYVDLWAIVDPGGRALAAFSRAGAGKRLSLNGLVEKALDEKTPLISTELVPYATLKDHGIAGEAGVAVAAQGEGAATRALTDGMAIVVVTPVFAPGGSVAGAIVTADLVNNDPFVPDAAAEGIPGSFVAIALGNVQISTNVAAEGGRRGVGRRVPDEALAELGAKRGFRGVASMAGAPHIAAFDPILDHRGSVIGSLSVGTPLQGFAAMDARNMKAVGGIALMGLVLATGVGIFITYMITRPIKAITRKAQLVSRGDLDVRTDSEREGGDEIADLARTFDVMVKNVRINEESIRVGQGRLRQQKNLIESIINSLPYCLYVLERNLGIVVWNRHPAAGPCPICNCTQGVDSYNLNFIAHIRNAELKNGLDKLIHGVFDTGEPRQVERKVTLRPGGAPAYLRTSVFPIFSIKGRPADYVVWMAEDITKKKEIEAGVITSEKLAAIGQLAAGMAHEVNNPLGGILNCLYNLKKGTVTDGRRGEYLEFMEDGIKRVQNIVGQLLDFSQQHAPELTLTDINSLIDGVMPLFLHSIKGRDVRLVRNLGQGLPPILVDKHQIEQVLVNLILNALQAVDGDGVIDVSTAFEGEWYRITVSDNGCGIPPENVPKIFDPFFTTKGVGKGTGLGLSVSRGIIERHRGRIEVESAAGKGTAFKVYLPLAT